MHLLTPLLLLTLSLPAHATLYKCQDDAGRVTYTNLPCERNNLKETKIVPPPPAPAEPAPAAPPAAQESSAAARSGSAPEDKGGPTLQLFRSAEPKANKCAQINETMGKLMDDMDSARRQGYTQKQEAEWNARLKKLQAEKNKHGCF
jgi:hypothetical protein